MKNNKHLYSSYNFSENNVMRSVYDETREWRKHIEKHITNSKNELMVSNAETIKELATDVKNELKENTTLMQTLKELLEKLTKYFK